VGWIVSSISPGYFCRRCGPIAQLEEPPAHNRSVPGSNPGGPIIRKWKNWRSGLCVSKCFVINHTPGPAARQYLRPTAKMETESFFENAPADGAFFISTAGKGMDS
jgi:hypothetical protein